MAGEDRENAASRPFQLLCDGLDAVRGAIDVGILGSAVAGALGGGSGLTPPQASNALLAPAITEGAYAFIMSLALLKKTITDCRGDGESCGYHTLFRLGTVVMSATASALIFVDATSAGAQKSIYAQIGVPLAAL